MDLDAGGSLLDQLQNQLHPDTTPQASAAPLSIYEEEPVPETDSAIEAPPAVKRDLDISSEELFPALPAAAPGKSPIGAWATKGINGHARAASASSGSSRGATPSGGIGRPKKITERFEIPAQLQANLQNEKGKPITAAYVCKQIMSRLGTSIDLSSNSRTGVLTVLINGKPEAVKQTKREVISALTLQVKEVITIPASVRPHLVGKAGANIKALMARTLTKIDIPRNSDEDRNAPVSDNLMEEEPEQDVVIIGDYEGVEEAKKAIETLVSQRTSKRTLRVSIERSYHPFIAGPNGSQVQLLQLETDTRIHIPPVVPTLQDKGSSDILIVGERTAVLAAEERLRAIYEEVKRTTRTLQIPVKKRQHRFIIGQKGAALQEVMEQTGCHVELPPPSDPSETITIRGPENMLSQALQLVIEKSNSIVIDEIDVVATISPSTDPELFLRYVYTKERNQLKAIESAHNATILQQKSTEGNSILEIQSKTKMDTDAARAALYALVKEWGSLLSFGVVEIPSGLHKFVVGKGGQNITKVRAKKEWDGRLVDVIVPHESDESDEVLIVVKRIPGAKGGLAASDKESSTLIEKVKEELESQATALADLVTQTISIDPKYHGRLIGAGGAALKELLSPYGNAVTVKFPKNVEQSAKESKANGKESDPSAVVIRGPKKEAMEVADKISKQVAEWRHVELMSSFSEVITVPKGLGRRLVGSGKDLKWIVSAVREKVASGEVHKSKISEKELTPPNLNLRAEVDVGVDQDTLTLYGPKTIVALAKAVVAERAQKLADTVTEEVDLFNAVSGTTRKSLHEIGGDIRRKVLRRIIGKEGKGIKRISEKHSIYVKFADRNRTTVREDDEDENASVEDLEASEEATGSVSIKGSVADVAAARKELVELVEHEILHSFVATFLFAKACLPHIVGRAGAKVQKLKDECDVRIDFRDMDDDDENVECIIEGTKEGCADARQKILEAVDDMVNTQSVEMQIPSYLHKHIIGPGGSKIRSVIDNFGGPDKLKVQFPRAHVDPASAQDTVTIKAHLRVVPEVQKELERLVHEALSSEEGETREVELVGRSGDSNVVEKIISIPKADSNRVAGRSGEGLMDVMKRFGVTVWYEEGSEQDDFVKIRIAARIGKESDVHEARNELLSRVRISQSVPIPHNILEAIQAATGAERDMHLAALQDIAKRVRQESGVFPELSSGATKGSEGACFVVRGDTKAVDKGVKSCEKFLDELTKYTHSHRIQLDSDLRPHLIGRQGFTINRLRSESGAEIDIIRGAQKGTKDTVVIRGISEASVEKARQMIEGIVHDQEERLRRDREREERDRERERELESRRVQARIDDDDADHKVQATESSDQPSVPGWSGRAHVHRPSRNKKKRVDETATPSPPPLSRESSTASYWSYVEGVASKKDESGWKEVGGGKKAIKGNKEKADDAKQPREPEPKPEVDEVQVEGGATAAKKKKKKKGAAAGPEAAPPLTGPVPVSPSARPPSPVKQEPVAQPKVQETARPPSPAKAAAFEKPLTKQTAVRPVSPAPSASAVREEIKQVPTLPEFEVEDVEAQPENDGWQTVNSVKKFKQAKLAAQNSTTGIGSVPTMPGGDEEAAKKKKKNKKKKKKAGNDGAAMPGDGE
ncbi:uncharacterized protein SPPG_07662 [Spizellomyces punctatus DAOM BR117]|uniref:K Homology domain-containing protein n=1 Tax=Spizellomyces punctatus (strain DAOM BR117) TaxID=645134 RepID=A0A0L0H803_SPIPD|nr:uncharacterized protein SPPG_07662 [Spizellomyces punctatus DAOM BR117]KNC96828.1 hypothetical protein SPPG_07662 [Spizellomyces punctatus DAOM BR117]|eukprot:XP_016604868.1 hypothetical protein SPPG_07662 [Spizellomyces punctatus DAOM BR117]